VIDTLLAATAVVHDLVFVTRNQSDVQDLPVQVFNPWRSLNMRIPVDSANVLLSVMMNGDELEFLIFPIPGIICTGCTV
jgi:hypothetical protein